MKGKMNSNNLFFDLGFDKDEAASLLIRSNLMIEISKYIQKHKMTQAQAAKLLGVTQPRISDLKRGKIQLFTVDMLITMLARAGVRVDVVLSKRKAA